MKILLPCYNYVYGVKKIIESIGNNFIISISDNSDNDKIRDIVHKYKNIEYVKRKPQGPVKNWNYLLNDNNNNFNIIIHDDEYLLKKDIKKIKKIKLEKDTVYFFNYKVFENKHMINFSHNNFLREFLIKNFPKLILFLNFTGPTAAYAFFNDGKNIYDKNMIWHVDLDFLYRIIQKKKIKFLDICAYTFLKNNSLTKKVIKNKLGMTIKELVYIRNKYKISLLVFNIYLIFSCILRLYFKFLLIGKKQICQIKY